MGKTISAEVPAIGVVGKQDRIFEAFSMDLHLGAQLQVCADPIVCAAAETALRMVRERGVVSRARSLGKVLMQRREPLRALRSIGDIRGKGPLIGVQFDDRSSKARWAACRVSTC